MLSAIWRVVRRTGNRLTGILREWQASWREQRFLSRLSSRERDVILADAGLSHCDLSVLQRLGVARRQLMIRTMTHFKVDPQATGLRYWGALRDAERVCAQCRNVKRCRHWHAWGVRNDAPRVFCPNAELFDDMAGGGRANRHP